MLVLVVARVGMVLATPENASVGFGNDEHANNNNDDDDANHNFQEQHNFMMMRVRCCVFLFLQRTYRIVITMETINSMTTVCR